MALSERVISKALDKFKKMTEDENCFIFILSSLKNDKECQFFRQTEDTRKYITSVLL